MIILRHLYIFFIVALSVANWPQQGFAALSETLAPETIAPGQRTVLTIALDFKDLEGVDLNDEQSIPELLDEPFNKADGILLLDKSYERTKSQFIWKYIFTGYVPTTYRIPPVEIRFGAQTFSTSSKPFTVSSTRGDDEELRPEFGEEEIAKEYKLFWPLLLLAMAFLITGFLVIKNRFKPKKVIANSDTFESLDQWLKRELTALTTLATTLTPTETATKFSSLLREYLQRRYLSPTPAMTLRELLIAVKKWDGTQDSEAIAALLLKIESILFNRPESQETLLDKALMDHAILITETKWLKNSKEESP